MANKSKNTAPTPPTADEITVVAQTDPNAPTTDEEVTSTETVVVDGKDLEVLTVDETPKVVLATTGDTIFVKLKDGTSCWGAGSIFISGSEIKEFISSPFILDGIRSGALIECDKQGKPK